MMCRYFLPSQVTSSCGASRIVVPGSYLPQISAVVTFAGAPGAAPLCAGMLDTAVETCGGASGVGCAVGVALFTGGFGVIVGELVGTCGATYLAGGALMVATAG